MFSRRALQRTLIAALLLAAGCSSPTPQMSAVESDPVRQFAPDGLPAAWDELSDESSTAGKVQPARWSRGWRLDSSGERQGRCVEATTLALARGWELIDGTLCADEPGGFRSRLVREQDAAEQVQLRLTVQAVERADGPVLWPEVVGVPSP